jgi:23S rRNA (cytosine1962-C5)-methyltransferase
VASVKLKRGRDKSVLRKHPWIFSGAIDSVKEFKENGEPVDVFSADGKLVAKGAYCPHSQIAVRIFSFYPEEIINPDFFRKKIEDAIQLRKTIINYETTNALRIINAEGDYLPGLVVDKYGDFLVCQFLSAGIEFWKHDIVELLKEFFQPIGILERSDSENRLKEGLEPTKGILYGNGPPDLFEVVENNLKFLVDMKKGHKTGFYLDQRDNRMLISDFAKDKEILNCFSFSAGFSVYALKAGAKKVINLDSSQEALELAEKNLVLNGFTSDKFDNIQDDVFKYLRKLRDTNNTFDMIILDPPKFAESASQITKASRGYKDINLLAMKLLKPGGTLFTFSCSGHITLELFNKIIADAAVDSNKNVHIIKFLSQSSDHIISSNFPEGLYLKGLICRVS